ncbi:hypothetical protein N7492_010265 [Penicillium capsulatum]|uniref:Uncharacterized protein n=1 Tax=Penicillium capsulatum TaxID=69766 RepID=A0A9W9LFA4_9EURO|nr:hypothetical protein N7492_010265 [Penicillium capsulatum]KAJ6112772.1 hypothetical protein N7512_008096 [Penicillium capsulatum]
MHLLFLLPLTLATTPTTPYPTKDEIRTILAPLAETNLTSAEFFAHVSPSVHWTIQGTHPAAGVYTNRSVLEATFARIAATGSMQRPLAARLINVIGGGDEEWSVEELQVQGFPVYPICLILIPRFRARIGLIFDNHYPWATRWDSERCIVEARAYLDSALVAAALQQNEIGALFTYVDPRDRILAFCDAVGGGAGRDVWIFETRCGVECQMDCRFGSIFKL